MCLAPRWFIVKLWTGERRKRLRSGHFGGRKLRIDHSGRLLAAKVVDFSDRGFGVEMSSSLHAGLSVSFVGAGLQGRAQVIHCEPDHDGWFRVGFALEQVTFRKLDSFIRTSYGTTRLTCLISLVIPLMLARSGRLAASFRKPDCLL